MVWAPRTRSEWIVRFTPWVSVSGFFTNWRDHERRFPCARWSRWHGGFPRSPKHGDSGSQSRTESEFYNTSCGFKSLRFSLQRGDNHTTGWTKSSASQALRFAYRHLSKLCRRSDSLGFLDYLRGEYLDSGD